MAIANHWIRNNMLFSMDNAENKRMPESDLPSLENIQINSISRWYLNNYLKLSPNVRSVEYHSLPWKHVLKESTIEFTSNEQSGTSVVTENNQTNNHETFQTSRYQGSPKKQKFLSEFSPKASNNGGTFPKTSASKKIQHINIDLKPETKLHLEDSTESTEKESDETTVDTKENSVETNPKMNFEDSHERLLKVGVKNISCETPTKNATVDFSFLETTDTLLRTPNVDATFYIPDVSTPKKQQRIDFNPSKLFGSDCQDNTSTILTESLDIQVSSSQSLMEKAFVVEEPFITEGETNELKFENFQTFHRKKSVLSLSSDASSTTSKKSTNSFLERYLHCIQQTTLRKDVPPIQPKQRRASLVREMVQKIDLNNRASEFTARSVSPKNDDVHDYNCNYKDYSKPAEPSMKIEKKKHANGGEVEETDLVYWIPMSRHEIRRSSSIQSGISKISDSSQWWSPSVSVIENCNSESETLRRKSWVETFGKKKPSRTDEKLKFRKGQPVVIDSGYLDKSDESQIDRESSTTDCGFSKNIPDDSESVKYSRKKSPVLARRRSMYIQRGFIG